MGLAIIVPDVSFGDANLGKVTLSGSVPIRGLYINLEDFYAGTTVDLKCSYLPANTTQRDVVWSIESGSEYASIRGSVLTISQDASNNEVTLKCTSASNSSVYATKIIRVTHIGAYRYVKYIAVQSADNGASTASYVNTGIKPKSGQSIEITGGRTGTPGTGGFFGARNSMQSSRVLLSFEEPAPGANSQIIMASPNGNVYAQTSWGSYDGNLIDFKFTPISPYAKSKSENNTNWVDWSLINNYNGTIPDDIDYPYYLFVANTGGVPTASSVMEVRISKFKISESDNVVVDLRAVAIGSTPYFRDEISGEFFPIEGNALVTFAENE